MLGCYINSIYQLIFSLVILAGTFVRDAVATVLPPQANLGLLLGSMNREMDIRAKVQPMWESDDPTVDYALARLAVLRDFRQGRLSRLQVCDAQPELIRAASHLGRPKKDPCPICERESLVSVMYAFGPKLPAHGRCLEGPSDLSKLHTSSFANKVYEVEVCLACRWNHLERMSVLGTGDAATA